MLAAFCDATVFTGEAMVENHALLVKDSKILDIVANHKVPGEAQKTSCKDQIIVPGFIDAQVNGGGNLLFNNRPTAETCVAIAKAHAKYGTTHILPTVITDRPEITAQAISAVREARKKHQGILGIHIEGPHLGVERRGVHNKDYIRPLEKKDLELYRPESDEVMLITVAPENVSPEQIKQLRQQGAIVSLGHTSAPHAKIHAALAAGATGFTHLFNGMGKPEAGKDYPVDVALKDQNSWCGIIADGHHVSPELMKLALKSKPPGKLFLVSDAMPPAASDNPQSFKLYDEVIRVENGRCVNKEGRLAGSSITLLDAVRHCVKTIGVEMEEALRMASLYPAEFLGLDKKLGKLLPGYGANFTAFHSNKF